MIYFTLLSSPIGIFTIAGTNEYITNLWFDDQSQYIKTHFAQVSEQTIPIFKDAQKWLDCYFSGKEPTLTLPLLPKGSEFQHEVWSILLKIPYGKVITYGDIAKEIGKKVNKKMSAQAVGGAVGSNPIPVIIPCHRVIGAKGNLTGFASGLKNKIALLKAENIPMDNFFIPKKGTKL